MAIDTRDKRACVVCIATGTSYPTPDLSINDGDRKHIVREYRGIASSVVAAKKIIGGMFALRGERGSHRRTLLS